MTLEHCVPKDKHDTRAVANAAAVGFPTINAILPDLLEWTEDPNWPVADHVFALLAGAGAEIAPLIKAVLDGSDEEWKYSLLTGLLKNLGPGVIALLRPSVESIANSAATGETENNNRKAAQEVIDHWNRAAHPDELPEAEMTQRYAVTLLVVHPTIDPADIEKALGLEGTHSQRAGDQRKAPNGVILPGKYEDTRWRYSVRYHVSDQWFVDGLEEVLDELEPGRSLFKHVRDTGGATSIIVSFLGDPGHFGDDIPPSLLNRLVELGLSLGIEVYTTPQR